MRENKEGRGGRRAGSAIALLCFLSVALLLPFALAACSPKRVDGVTISLTEERVRVIFEPVKRAKKYEVEYAYDGEERESGETEENVFEFPRRAGTLEVRVRAVDEKGRKGRYSEPIRTTVEKIVLPTPGYAFRFYSRTDESGTYYQISRNAGWQPVTVPNQGGRYEVEFYRIVTVAPGQNEELAFRSPITFEREELFEHKFRFTAGEWKIYASAVPYQFFAGQIIPEPSWLNARYAEGGWRLSTLTVV